MKGKLNLYPQHLFPILPQSLFPLCHSHCLLLNKQFQQFCFLSRPLSPECTVDLVTFTEIRIERIQTKASHSLHPKVQIQLPCNFLLYLSCATQKSTPETWPGVSVDQSGFEFVFTQHTDTKSVNLFILIESVQSNKIYYNILPKHIHKCILFNTFWLVCHHQ